MRMLRRRVTLSAAIAQPTRRSQRQRCSSYLAAVVLLVVVRVMEALPKALVEPCGVVTRQVLVELLHSERAGRAVDHAHATAALVVDRGGGRHHPPSDEVAARGEPLRRRQAGQIADGR